LDYHPPHLLLDNLGRRGGLGLAGLCLLAIASADYLTGYSLRLSPLYLAPITIAAWVGGTRAGLASAVTACLLWLFSFRTEHLYLNPGFYLWEALSMLTGFVVVVWLAVRLHKTLSQADERFVRVLEEMRAAVYVANEENDRFLYANPEMQRLDTRFEQLTPQAFEQQFVGETALASQEGPLPATSFVSRQLKNTRNGRWYLLQEGPIPWGKQRQVKLKVLTDITEQKNAQRMREIHCEIAHQSSRVTTLAEIASTLAHEINQPLMVIATYTDACQRLLAAPNPDHGEIIGVLGKCHGQAVRAASIIERLREFIRQRQHQPAPWVVKAMVGEALDVSRPLLEEAHVVVDNSQVGNDLIVVADRVLLVQVLANLIRNAIDAMQAVPVATRRLTISATPTTDGSVLISVADRGCGLGSLPIDEMFAPFVTTKGQGLGLGLAISRSVAESHQGSLWATDNPDGGAIFHLSIPAGRAVA
jgi:C4-dicarboxylate-specific signal transduction histidine kinase